MDELKFNVTNAVDWLKKHPAKYDRRKDLVYYFEIGKYRYQIYLTSGIKK